MIVVESPHPPGVIGFTGAELARYHHFTGAWSQVQVPTGTTEKPGLGYDTACNSNDIVRAMMERPDAEWVWIMDDDHVFNGDTLIRLLDANVDVIVPLYSQRVPPFRPCLFGAETDEGWPIMSWVDLEGKSGVMPIQSAGKGGILIRRRVIRELARLSNPEWLLTREALNAADPDSEEAKVFKTALATKYRAPSWFEWEKGRIGEDHTFFKKCIAAGFQPYVHLDVLLGHLSTFAVWPHTQDGRWCGRASIGGNAFVEYWDKKYTPTPTGVLEC